MMLIISWDYVLDCLECHLWLFFFIIVLSCDYFGIELWHCVCENSSSYVVIIFFTNVDWVDVLYFSRFWILCLWCDIVVDLIAYVFFLFILYYYMFSKLTPLLFVFVGLALRLRNCSSIGYEFWSQVHAFYRELSCVICCFREKALR